MFYIDNETLKDIEVFSFEKKRLSLLDCFKKTLFLGGFDKVREIFSSPVNNLEEINNRQDIIKFFNDFNLSFESSKEDLDYIEYYLVSNVEPLRANNPVSFFLKSVAYRLLVKRVYDYNVISLPKVVRFLQDLKNVMNEISSQSFPPVLIPLFERAKSILTNKLFQKLTFISPHKRIFFLRLFRYDAILRVKHSQEFKKLLQFAYLLDAFSTIAKVAEERSMCFPTFIESQCPLLEMEGLSHPFLDDPVRNNLILSDGMNMVFLTGPNMAGKTTLLKAVGISVYMAHLGLPVPCLGMRLSVFNGLITNINTSDNLKIGYSYYYSEVKRVKSVAEKIRDHHKMFWIADELFRGTNIKDAYDASKLIVSSFARIKDSVMIISSHLMELAKDISTISSINFKQMGTVVKDEEPHFTYTISDGVSDVRLGLYIIKKEGIEEIINECQSN